jgi:hypothetical protein
MSTFVPGVKPEAAHKGLGMTIRPIEPMTASTAEPYQRFPGRRRPVVGRVAERRGAGCGARARAEGFDRSAGRDLGGGLAPRERAGLGELAEFTFHQVAGLGDDGRGRGDRPARQAHSNE